jgi:hypothetical protein
LAPDGVDDPGGLGTEIVRELRACDERAAKVAALKRRREPPSVSEPVEWPTMRAAS